MTLYEIIQDAYRPALEIIGVADTPQARVMMLAIGLQESRFTHRRQMNNGPATGFWQFERGGGVKGVLQHPASKARAERLCKARGVAAEPMDAWAALETDDVLAAGFARLLLLTDPRTLPDVSNSVGAWDCYIRNWRPGKPHIQTWTKFHREAREAVL